jgi:hypothetical protein
VSSVEVFSAEAPAVGNVKPNATPKRLNPITRRMVARIKGSGVIAAMVKGSILTVHFLRDHDLVADEIRIAVKSGVIPLSSFGQR